MAAKLGLLSIIASMLLLGLVLGVTTHGDGGNRLVRRETPSKEDTNTPSAHSLERSPEKMEVLLGSTTMLSNVSKSQVGHNATMATGFALTSNNVHYHNSDNQAYSLTFGDRASYCVTSQGGSDESIYYQLAMGLSLADCVSQVSAAGYHYMNFWSNDGRCRGLSECPYEYDCTSESCSSYDQNVKTYTMAEETITACANTDNGASDTDGDNCAAYQPHWCGGDYDNADFRSSEMCCICGGGQASTGSECDEGAWPDLKHGLVCGECMVLVNLFNTKYHTCDAYCQNIGKECVGAWEEWNDGCNVKDTLTCSQDHGSSDAICQCSGGGLQAVVFEVEGQGHCQNGQVYASSAWELADSGLGQKGFDTPEYNAWVKDAWSRCKHKNAQVKVVSVQTDAGYRCYTDPNCSPNNAGNTKSWRAQAEGFSSWGAETNNYGDLRSGNQHQTSILSLGQVTIPIGKSSVGVGFRWKFKYVTGYCPGKFVGDDPQLELKADGQTVALHTVDIQTADFPYDGGACDGCPSCYSNPDTEVIGTIPFDVGSGIDFTVQVAVGNRNIHIYTTKLEIGDAQAGSTGTNNQAIQWLPIVKANKNNNLQADNNHYQIEDGSFMIVDGLVPSDYEISGKYKFKLVFKSNSRTMEMQWTQTSWLTSGSPSGFQAVSISDTDGSVGWGSFSGLRACSQAAFCSTNGWWAAVGQRHLHNGGIPAWNNFIADDSELFVFQNQEGVTVQLLSNAKSHCFRRANCAKKLIEAGTFGFNELCECEGAVAYSLNTNLDCSPWTDCLEQDTDHMYNRVLALVLQASEGMGSTLLQQSRVMNDPEGCIDLTQMDVENLECNCWAVMENFCTQSGGVTLTEDELAECMELLMCNNPLVCPSWKAAHQCDPPSLYDTSKELRVDPNLDNHAVTYEEMRHGLFNKLNLSESELHAHWDSLRMPKEDVAVVAARMQGRRQLPGSTSLLDHEELDQSISGKAACASAR